MQTNINQNGIWLEQRIIESYNDQPKIFGKTNKNLVCDVRAGGRIVRDDNYSVHNIAENADTYFFAIFSEPLVAGKQYTTSCRVEGIPDSGIIRFVGNAHTNPDFSLTLTIENGKGYATWTAKSALTEVIFDDTAWISPAVRGTTVVYIRDLKIEEGSFATPWCPNEADYNGVGAAAVNSALSANNFYEI